MPAAQAIRAAPRAAPTPLDLGAVALRYAHLGLRVFPLLPRAKRPRYRPGFHAATWDPLTLRAWWTENPAYNLGIATGAGLVVLDIDPAHGGADWWMRHPAWTPPTWTARSGGGGHHLWYLVPADLAIDNSVGGLAPGVDVRGDGGYIVAPPSVHPTGRPYVWLPDQAPGECACAPLDPHLLAALVAYDCRRPPGTTAPPAAARQAGGAAGQPIPTGQRNSTLASLAGTMRRRGMSYPAIRAALAAENEARCRPPLDLREVQTIAASISRYPPG